MVAMRDWIYFGQLLATEHSSHPNGWTEVDDISVVFG